MNDVEVASGVFCPKCHSTDLECTNADMPEWCEDMEICTKEDYVCKACGHEFAITASYEMTCFNFLEEGDDRDILIEKE